MTLYQHKNGFQFGSQLICYHGRLSDQIPLLFDEGKLRKGVYWRQMYWSTQYFLYICLSVSNKPLYSFLLCFLHNRVIGIEFRYVQMHFGIAVGSVRHIRLLVDSETFVMIYHMVELV